MIQTLRVFFVLTFVRFLNVLWIAAGKLLSKRRQAPLRDIGVLVINRSDRIGDAVISKPFLKLLFEFLRNEKGWKGEIRLLVSGYNREILESLSECPGVSVEAVPGTTSYAYERSVFDAAAKLLRSFRFFLFRPFSRKRGRVAFVDLVDSVTEGVEVSFEGKDSAYWASSNRGPYSALFDFCLPERFAGSSRRNLIEGYLELFCDAFGIPEFRDYVYARLGEFYPADAVGSEDAGTPERSGILVFAGVKEFRNVSTGLWVRIIRALASEFPNETVEVTDMKNHALLPILEKEAFPKNVRFVRNGFSFDGLAEYAKTKRFVLGVDGGDINVLRPNASAAVIYTLGNPWVWSSFSGDRPVTEIPLGPSWVVRYFEVSEKNFQAFLFKRAWYVPSFQISVGKERFDDLDAEAFARFVALRASPEKNGS